MMRFFFTPVGAPEPGLVPTGTSGGPGASSVGLMGVAMLRGRGLAAYPDDKLFIVLVLVNAGSSATWFVVGLGWRRAFVASCRCCLSFLRSSFDDSPGHSAGTFISHLLWHV